MNSEILNIRASMLPAYNDCPRRAAAKQYRDIITNAGFNLRETKSTIGAAVGTSCHYAAKCMVECKMQGTPHQMSDVIWGAIDILKTETEKGVSLDDMTGSMNDAEKVVQQLLNAFERDVLPTSSAVELEKQLVTTVAAGVQFSGRFDIEHSDEVIDDWKFGSKMRYYGSQLGGYSILRKSSGGRSASKISIYHLPRFSLKKSYPGTKRYFYNRESCEAAAYYTIIKIKTEIERFVKTGNPWSFAANPMSTLCSEKYCPAFGTNFCDMAI